MADFQMSTSKNKKAVIAEALLDVDNITSTLKEESKNIISNLLKEGVKNALRESIDEDEKDYEIQGDGEDTSTEDSGEESAPEIDNAEGESEDADFSFNDDENDGESNEPESEDEDSAEVPEDDEQEGDEWSDLDQYKVGDDTYDLTGEKDYDTVVKVYKRLKDEDNVVVKKDGDKISIEDKEADTEYVIDLGSEAGEDSEAESSEEDNMFDMNEDASEYAGLPMTNESKKNRKTMKENKELVFEVDLGYTDNYQSKDPIEGLSNNEPSKNKTLDQGIPTGTEKPWAKDAKSKGDPYGEKTIDEGEDVEFGGEPIMADGEQEPELEEGAKSVSSQSFAKTTHTPTSQPRAEHKREVSKLVHANGGYVAEGKKSNKAMVEAIEAKYKAIIESLLQKTEAVIKENKELKEDVLKIKNVLQENLVVTNSLGSINRLFMENTTTYKEKVDIINRFNEAKTIEQTKSLYETINRELKQGVKQTLPLQESSMTVDGSAINETKLYESQDLLEVKNFMKRMANC